MNLNLNSIPRLTTSLIKDNIQPILSVYQKQILTIVTIAFACLTALYLANRYYFKINLSSQNLSSKTNTTPPIKIDVKSPQKDNLNDGVTRKETEFEKPILNPTQQSTPLNLERFSLGGGYSLKLVTSGEKVVLNELVNRWNTRDSSKTEWSLSELAVFLKQDESVLQKLFDLVYLVPNSDKNYPKFGIEKVFQCLQSTLSGDTTFSGQPGVKLLWSGRVPSAVQISGQGSDKKIWKLAELEQFLAVSQPALIEFFGEKEQYSYDEVDQRLKTAKNSDVNGILEKNRTQKGSIRWGMLAS